MEKVLITGGAGFVGSHLADALIARGHEVVLFDNLSPQVHPEGVPTYLHPKAKLMQGDVRDYSSVRGALEGVDVIFHFAAAVGVGQSMYEIAHYMSTNTQGTAVLLQALLDREAQGKSARGARSRTRKLVVASSMSIYGEGRYLCSECGEAAPHYRPAEQLKAHDWEVKCPRCGRALTPIATGEDKPLNASSVYALSKKDQEDLCLIYGRTYGLPVVALRYFNIYGTRQALSNPYTGVAAIFGSRLLNGRPPLIFEDGRQMRDFVSVHDVVQANLLAMERSDADGMALNIGSGEPISVREVADLLGRALDTDVRSEVTEKFRAGDIRHCFADIASARRLLGYAPRVRFADGVAELMDWVRQQRASDKAGEAAAQLEQFGLTA